MDTEDSMEERLMAGIRLLVPLIMYGLTFAGIALDADLVYCVLLGIAGIASTVWTWWKNNNVTEAAQEAQKYLDAIKKGYEGIPADWDDGIVQPLKDERDGYAD